MDSYKKIIIAGSMGSGKSTLATVLSKQYKMPMYSMDKLYFITTLSEEEKKVAFSEMGEIIKEDTFIIDGLSKKLLDDFDINYDIIIHINLSVFRTIWQVLKRKDNHYGYNVFKIVYWSILSRRRNNKFIKQFTNKIFHITSYKQMKDFNKVSVK